MRRVRYAVVIVTALIFGSAGSVPSVQSAGSPRTRATVSVVGTIPASIGTAADISCVDALVCVVVGSAPPATPPLQTGAFIERTANGGQSWSAVALPAGTLELRSVDCTTTGICVATGISTFALYSSDGGVSWTATGHLFDFADSVDCPAGSTCYATAVVDLFNRIDGVLKTVDGGATWNVVYLTTPFSSLHAITCSDEAHCIVQQFGPPGGVGAAVHTIDGGLSWSPIPFAGIQGVYLDGCSGSVCFVDTLTPEAEPGFITTRSWRSIDAGQTWSEIVPLQIASWPIVCGHTICVAASYGPSFFVSENLGSSWVESSLPGVGPWRIDCPAESVCFLAGGQDTQANSPLVRIDLSVRPFVSIRPARLLETRTGPNLVTIDGAFQGGGLVPARSVVTLPVLGRGGIGTDAATVSLNVTVTEPKSDGFVAVYPCGGDVPLSSSVNFRTGQTVANAVTTQVGAGGAVCLYTEATTHLIVDVNGFVPTGLSSVASVVPARLLDTRPGTSTVDHADEGGGMVPANTVRSVHVRGRGGVALDAATAWLNVTVTEPQADGYITVYPCGGDVPLASSINFRVGQTVANAVATQIGAGGDVCIFTTAAVHVIVDVNAFVPAGVPSMASVLPARLLETRRGAGSHTVDGLFEGGGPISLGTAVQLPVAGRGGVSPDASSVWLNVTVTEPAFDGYVAVYPCGGFIPVSSSVNYVHGQTVANSVVTGIGTAGSVCLYSSSTTQLVVDVNGYSL